jgi:hypothetical protein
MCAGVALVSQRGLEWACAMKITTEKGGEPGREADPLREPESALDEERWVLCVACGGRLAKESARIDVDGSHEHSFMNPSGIRFVVACFRAAPGCDSHGEPSSVWTWFPGRAWQIALCKACGAHVGWSFQAPETSPFHALIHDRIASDVGP